MGLFSSLFMGFIVGLKIFEAKAISCKGGRVDAFEPTLTPGTGT